ncbi:MAG TPA: hypothetical protein VHF69_00820 [Candidatus Synoicihabitans sp.]|nr:hypothetical protein [Candidatus Synoicihabitans sp.]
MTTGGWINMVLSVGFVTVLFVYCILRVLRGPGAKHEHELARVEPIDETHADER